MLLDMLDSLKPSVKLRSTDDTYSIVMQTIEEEKKLKDSISRQVSDSESEEEVQQHFIDYEESKSPIEEPKDDESLFDDELSEMIAVRVS